MSDHMHTRSAGLAAVIVVAALALAGCSIPAFLEPPASEATAIAAAPATGATVKGSGYSFAVPKGWSADEVSPEGVDAVAGNLTDADGFADNVNVVVSGSPTITPGRVESTIAAALEASGASDVKIRNRVMIAGSEAAHLSAMLSSQGVDYQIEQFYLSSDEQTMCVVTFAFSPTVSESDRHALSESVLATWAWA